MFMKSSPPLAVYVVIVAVLLSLAPPLGAAPAVSVVPGQTATQLPDGRWLLLGGADEHGTALDAVSLWDPRAQTLTPLPSPGQARASHTATVISDGRVLILGGIGAAGSSPSDTEIFDPTTLEFSPFALPGFAPRAHHTATLLTDGRVLVTGGVSTAGTLQSTTELWDPSRTLDGPLVVPLIVGRKDHTATLLPDGTVLLSGGVDEHGRPVADGEVYDPRTESFSLATGDPPTAVQVHAPGVTASVPADGATDVLTDAVVTLRFSGAI